MKKLVTQIILISGLLLIISQTVFAQAPDYMSYQAVIRSGNDLLKNTVVSVEISILQGSETGTAVYSESHEVSTNANGLLSIRIGNGDSPTGVFNEIDWSHGPYFLKTETTPEGGDLITGTTQILSVPYALFAKNVANEADPVFSEWDKSEGITITESQISDLGNYLTQEAQNLDDVLANGNSAENQNISDLADPVEAQDAATKAYSDKLRKELETLQEMLKLLDVLKIRDFDGNEYSFVKIGNQLWMTENLRTTHYNDGTPIPLVTDNSSWYHLTSPGYCWYANDSIANAQTYGAMYNWYTVENDHLCPVGWHLPSRSDYTELINFLGGTLVAGGKLKEAGTGHWTDPNTGATNESGFNALGGGDRLPEGTFSYKGQREHYWTNEMSGSLGYFTGIYFDNSSALQDATYKNVGFYVRCLKD